MAPDIIDEQEPRQAPIGSGVSVSLCKTPCDGGRGRPGAVAKSTARCSRPLDRGAADLRRCALRAAKRQWVQEPMPYDAAVTGWLSLGLFALVAAVVFAPDNGATRFSPKLHQEATPPHPGKALL